MLRNIHVLQQVLICDLSDIIKHGQNNHLKSADRHFISSGAIISDSSSKLCVALIHFPVELPATEFAQVVLLKHAHALLDLSWESLDFELGLLLRVVLSHRQFALIGPMSGGQHLDVEIDGDHGVAWALFELLHSLLGHLDVLEHHFQSLGELEAALLLQFLDNLSLSVLQDAPRVKKTLCKRILVEGLEHVLVFEEFEDLDDLIDLFGDVHLGIILELLFELVIQVHDKRPGCLLVLVDEALKRVFDCQVYVLVSLQ